MRGLAFISFMLALFCIERGHRSALLRSWAWGQGVVLLSQAIELLVLGTVAPEARVPGLTIVRFILPFEAAFLVVNGPLDRRPSWVVIALCVGSAAFAVVGLILKLARQLGLVTGGGF